MILRSLRAERDEGDLTQELENELKSLRKNMIRQGVDRGYGVCRYESNHRRASEHLRNTKALYIRMDHVGFANSTGRLDKHSIQK